MHAGGYPPPKPTSAHAVLPWLLVVRGSLEQRGLSAICAHFGKCSIDIVRLSADDHLRPRLKGALETLSPLDAFVDAVCGVHAAAMRAGLPPRQQWGKGGSQWGDLSLIHISEPTRQAEISYAVFCLKKKKS